MDFKNAQELLELCKTHHCPISEIMKQRECTLRETDLPEILRKMEHSLSVMRESAFTPLRDPKPSIGGLIGGEAKLVNAQEAPYAGAYSPPPSPAPWPSLRLTRPWD